jgi:hypothetical protein
MLWGLPNGDGFGHEKDSGKPAAGGQKLMATFRRYRPEPGKLADDGVLQSVQTLCTNRTRRQLIAAGAHRSEGPDSGDRERRLERTEGTPRRARSPEGIGNLSAGAALYASRRP